MVVIGAGFAGLAALHLLREQGLRVRAYDDAGNVGGTWWWHGYPGSHLDTESHVYQYYFSETLYRDWGWSERYPAGYEVQRWLRFVADRLDLRRDIRLSTRVVEARARRRPAGRPTDRGETVRARTWWRARGAPGRAGRRRGRLRRAGRADRRVAGGRARPVRAPGRDRRHDGRDGPARPEDRGRGWRAESSASSGAATSCHG